MRSQSRGATTVRGGYVARCGDALVKGALTKDEQIIDLIWFLIVNLHSLLSDDNSEFELQVDVDA